jgi:hypothetical protein
MASAFEYGLNFFKVHRPIYDSVVEYLSNSFPDRLPAFKNKYASSNDPEGYASIYLTDLLNEYNASLPKPAPRSYSAAVGSAPAYLSAGRAGDQEQNGNWSVVGRGGGGGGGGGGGSVASGGGGVLAQPDGGGGGGSNRATARNMSKGFFSAERIASRSADGVYKVQVQINPTQAGAIIGVGGETQQKLQRNTKTGISVLDGFILQVQSRTGNIKDVKEALRRIGEKLTFKKNEHIRMTLRKRKNQKTRKNRR